MQSRHKAGTASDGLHLLRGQDSQHTPCGSSYEDGPSSELGFPAMLGFYTAAQELLKHKSPKLSVGQSVPPAAWMLWQLAQVTPSAGGCLQGSLQLRSLGTRQAHEVKEPG